MICGIYKIENLINGKCYIGKSTNITRRWRSHRADQYKEETYNYPLYRAFRKYGLENFSFEVLEECPPEELAIKEQYYADEYDAFKNGYNQDPIKIDTYTFVPELVENIIKELQTNKTDNTEAIGKKFGVSGRTVRAINSGEAWYNSKLDYPIRQKYTNESHPNGIDPTPPHCIMCGRELKTRGAKYCQECFHILLRQHERPSREQLKQEIRNENFKALGRKYNTTDNTVRKWCIYYGLPSKKKEINQYSDEEWEKI